MQSAQHGDQTTGRRRRTSPPDDDDLLREILIRVPPQPSSLPRASLVCKRWRSLISDDPSFLRRLRAYHRKPPLLGFFKHRHLIFPDDDDHRDVFMFNPTQELSDRIPPQRFSLDWLFPAAMGFATSLLGCRHGRVLLLATSPDKVLTSLFVCDLVTDGHIQLVIPLEFTDVSINGTVICAAGDDEEGHVHGACHWSPLVLVAVSRNGGRPMACAYSSETGLWGNIIRHDRPGMFIDSDHSSTLIAHVIYWKIMSFGTEEVEEDMLEFDFDRQTLTVIKGLPVEGFDQSRIIRVLDNHMGIATLSYPTSHLRVWHWNVNGGRDGVATWVLAKTVDLRSIFGLQEHETLPLSPRRDSILGYDEDDGVIFIHVHSSLFMLQHDSMQFKRHYGSTEREHLSHCYPFRSFYHAGAATAVRSDGN